MIGRNLATALLACVVIGAGCATQPAKQNVEFLRGCWVMRAPPDGPVEMMLRLLPEGADGPTYRGVVQEISADGQLKPTVELWFSRDGRWMELTNHDPNAMVNAYRLDKTPVRSLASRPPEKFVTDMESSGGHWAAFSEKDLAPTTAGWIIALGSGDALSIHVVHGDGAQGQTIFMGRRDGCD